MNPAETLTFAFWTILIRKYFDWITGQTSTPPPAPVGNFEYILNNLELPIMNMIRSSDSSNLPQFPLNQLAIPAALRALRSIPHLPLPYPQYTTPLCVICGALLAIYAAIQAGNLVRIGLGRQRSQTVKRNASRSNLRQRTQNRSWFLRNLSGSRANCIDALSRLAIYLRDSIETTSTASIPHQVPQGISNPSQDISNPPQDISDPTDSPTNTEPASTSFFSTTFNDRDSSSSISNRGTTFEVTVPPSDIHAVNEEAVNEIRQRITKYANDQSRRASNRPSCDGEPGTSGTSIPGTSGTSIPGTSGTSIPGTSGTSIPGTSGTSIPRTSGTGTNPSSSRSSVRRSKVKRLNSNDSRAESAAKKNRKDKEDKQ